MTNRNELVHVSADRNAAPADGRIPEHQIEQALDDARALDKRRLIAIKVDVGVAATTCSGIGRQALRFRAELALMPGFDLHALDTLPATGLALAYAQAMYKAVMKPPKEIRDLAARGTQLRRLFASTAEALARAGVFDLREVKARRGVGTGYLRIMEALLMWQHFFREKTDWALVKSKSALTDELLNEADEIACEILRRGGADRRDPKKIAEAKELVQRVFTLAVRRYNEVRRGMIFLRQPFGDADEYAPSLFAKGPRGKRAEADAASAIGAAANAPGTTTSEAATGATVTAVPAAWGNGQ